METGDVPEGTSPAEAQALLRQLADDESAVRYPPLPRWFFLVMAAVVAGLSLVQLLSPSDSSKMTLALAVVALVPACRYWLFRDGVSGTSIKFGDLVWFLAGILGTMGVAWIIASTTGAWWVWIVSATVTAGIVLRTGGVYRRAFGS